MTGVIHFPIMRSKTDFQRRHIEARFISDTLTQIYDEFIDKNFKKTDCKTANTTKKGLV